MNTLFETGQDGGTATTHDWLTPPEILQALGQFDMDPCASEHQPWRTAAQQFTIRDDGLAREWSGRVWCNHCGRFTGEFKHENVLDVRETIGGKHTEFPTPEGNGGRPEIELQDVRAGAVQEETGGTQSRPGKATEATGRKEPLSTEPQGKAIEARSVLHRQPQAQTAKNCGSMEVDLGGLGAMSTRMGASLRVLRSRSPADAGSFHPAGGVGLSGDGSKQYAASVPIVQYEQATSFAACLAQRPTATCQDCGLPAFPCLKKPRVFCNPPYGPFAARFLERCADHGNAIAFVFARTETALFQDHVWPKADAMLFLRGRVQFRLPGGGRSGPAGAPSVLIAYGAENADCLASCGIPGAFVRLRAAELEAA